MKKNKLLLLVLSLGMFTCQSQEEHKCSFENEISVAHDLCGYVEVPNNWSKKENGSTRIAYVVIKSKSENRQEDPLVFVQGGPGGSVLPSANSYSRLSLDQDRDYIMYDQRGIGFSDAICPDLSASFLDVMRADITLNQEDEKLLEVSSDCIKSLNDPNFKTAFGTVESAKDLDALRQHLGYKQLNLFGASYGTRLSLKYMELFPKHVRSSILSGLFPPEIRLYENIYTNLNRSIAKLFDTCEKDANCSSKYPNLKENFKAVCKQLDLQGQTFEIDNYKLVINKQDFLLLIQQMLYNRQTIAETPAFIMAFKNEDINAVSYAIQAFTSRLGLINVATYWSINVKDEGAFNNTKMVEKDGEKYSSLTNGVSLFASDPDVLKSWPSQNNKNTKMEPVVSDIPTLLVSGEWDPITPPSNANKTSKSLSNVSHVIFPSDGHCPINACFFGMAKSFLNNPMQKVDGSCVQPNPIVFD
ncbi:MAG: alpha/beta fold hydrolase [Psychroserpens sp.]|uniref:alpha/beta fold hydrolase n=1 Tax=Psychroserpens sp. TaxID=2020870 RepID=UPI0030015AD8